MLGRGAFGVVFEAYSSRRGAAVAVKRVNLGEARAAPGAAGGGSSAPREVSVLQELQRHANIIELMDVFEHEGSTHLVFEMMATDLETVLLDRTVALHLGHVIAYLHMLLRGLQHLRGGRGRRGGRSSQAADWMRLPRAHSASAAGRRHQSR